MIMIVKTPGSQMGSPQQQKKEERRWEVGGGSGESSEVHERPSVTSTAPKAKSSSRLVATLDEAPRMFVRSHTFYF